MKSLNFYLSRFVICTIVMLLCYSESYSQTDGVKTRILVVGTIHNNHQTNKFYTYRDVVNIIATYKPDAICVEIPESYFRKRIYLKEMVLATIYGTDNSIPVYPIDWWAPENDRAKQSEYIKTDEYKIKEKQYEELEKADSIMQNFYARYGSLKEIRLSDQKGYNFFNGEEFNNYIREMYSINMKVFGDGPMNMHYLTRNNKMMSLIDSVITENKGRKIIVLTGVEHKHFFDDALSGRPDLNLIRFDDILPLKTSAPDKVITDYITKNLAKNYYDIGNTAERADMIYRVAIVSLTHGMGMDENPSVIPPENIIKAEDIIEQWRKETPTSVLMSFETAWVDFLKRDYKKAIRVLNKISNRLDEVPQNQQWFVKPYYYRNLGFCLDMIGKHDQAVKEYNSGIEVCKKLEMNESYIKATYKNYIEVPYNGEPRK